MSRTTQRELILAGIRTRLDSFFGQGGKVARLFRAVDPGPWRPSSPVRPRACVSDMGAKKTGGNSDAGKVRTLAWQIVIDLPQNWDKSETNWPVAIEQIVASIQNFSPGAAAIRTDVLSDDPMEVVLEDVASEHVWVIEGETDFYQVFCSFGDNEETMLEAARGLR